jgi:hypothetical protein
MVNNERVVLEMVLAVGGVDGTICSFRSLGGIGGIEDRSRWYEICLYLGWAKRS